jgi:hypothetical protein
MSAARHIGEHVMVRRDPGMPPAEAVIVAHGHDRPHLIKIRYLHSRASPWIRPARILGSAAPREAGGARVGQRADRFR